MVGIIGCLETDRSPTKVGEAVTTESSDPQYIRGRTINGITHGSGESLACLVAAIEVYIVLL
jgi:hypothetical protein